MEREALAVSSMVSQEGKGFQLECPNLTLVTDHKPLVKLFGDKELRDILNPRLLAI